jgi:PAS domain S-box-containing protein
LTENERKILRRWLESGEELAGYPILKNRILRNFGATVEDAKLIAEYVVKIEDSLPAEAQSEAVEIRKWLLSYLSKTAPELASDIGRITEQYSRQAVLLSAAMDNAPVATIVADRGGNVLYANNAFAKLAERPRSEVIGSRYDFSNQMEGYSDLMVESEGGQSFNGTIYTEKLGASPKWIEVSATSFKLNGGMVAFIVCLRDVTKRKGVEEKLKGLVEKL